MKMAFKTPKQRRSLAGSILTVTLLLLFGAFSAIPLYYAVVSSLKPMDELFIFPPRIYVSRPTADNYINLFNLISDAWVPMSRYLFNSVFVSVTATVGHVMLASMAAYPLAKYKLKISFLFNIVVIALLFNATILWIPQYIILSNVHLLNTYWVYILPVLPLPLGLFLMKQFISQVPTEIIESAKMDGAGHFRTYFSIVMPQVKPAWLTLTVFAFQMVWNQQPLNMVYDEDIKLINMAMTQITSVGMSRFGESMAVGVILMIPPILVFVFTQKNVIETMTMSGIKG